MVITLSPGTLGIPPMPLSDLVSLAGRHGYGGVDLSSDWIANEADAKRAREEIEAAGLRWGLFPRPADFFGSENEYREGLERLRTMAPLMALAGCSRTYDHVWSGSNDREAGENFRFHVDRLKPVAAILHEHGMRFGIEFLGPKTLRDGFRYPFFHTIDGALDLIDAVGEGAGLVFDTFHWYTSGGTMDGLRETLSGVPIVNVHVNDARSGRTRDEQMDLERAMPMETGVIDSPGLLAILLDLGYDGPVIAEPFHPTRDRYAAMTPDDAAAEAASVLIRLREEAERRRGGSGPTS